MPMYNLLRSRSFICSQKMQAKRVVSSSSDIASIPISFDNVRLPSGSEYVRKTKQESSNNIKVKPEAPDASECCGNGCPHCVWIDYWDRLSEWEAAQKAPVRIF